MIFSNLMSVNNFLRMEKYFIKVLLKILLIFLLLTVTTTNNNCNEHSVANSRNEEQCFDDVLTEIFPTSSDYDITSNNIDSHQLENQKFTTKSNLGNVKDNEDKIIKDVISDNSEIFDQEEKIIRPTEKILNEVKLDENKAEILEENSFVDILNETSKSPSYTTGKLNDVVSCHEEKQVEDDPSAMLTTPSYPKETQNNLKQDGNKKLQESYSLIPTENQNKYLDNSELNEHLSDTVIESKFYDNIKASKLIREYDTSINNGGDESKKSIILYEATTELKAELSNEYLNDNHLIGKNYEKSIERKDLRFNFGDLTESCTDCDLGILPIRAAAQKEKFRDASTLIPEVSIQFADVPPGNEFQVNKLDLSEGTFLFNYLGDFLSWLQPNDFPVDLMRGALRNQISITELITQSLQLEAGFVACLVVGVLFALAAPIAVLSHTCYRLRRRNRNDSNFDDTWAGNCRRRTLVLLLQILIIFLMTGVIAMVITNQQVSDALLKSEKVLHTVLGDLDIFLGNAHLQIHFAVTKHLEQAVQAVDSDINNVEILLGQPIQAELSRETGVDVALDSLRNIAQDANKVAELVEMVQLAAGLVGEALLLTREKLSDLRLQVDSFRRQCAPRDRPLCDTISINGLDIAMNVDFLRQDEKLKRVRQLGGPELRSAVESTRMLYKDIPRQMDVDTRTARQDVHRQLDKQRSRIDEDIRTLDSFFRSLRSKVVNSQNSLEDISSDIPDMEFYRWIIGLGSAGSLLLILALLQSGISCGCCGSEKSAAPTLLICVMLICLISTALWIVALVVLLVGGHGQVFVCRPLYQEPDFPALSQLLDHPGFLPNSRNFLSTLAYNNETMDVPLNRILRECQDNQAAYPTFQLKGIFNVDTMSELRQWDSYHDQLEKINVKLDHVKLLSPDLYTQLDELLQGLSVNLTAHRVQLSEPLTGKDLNAFAAQLDSVGNQLKDLATVSRIETLASRTRRLIATHIDPLKEKKENLMYQLTALDVQLGPLHHQVEQSISHLKTIQFFINSQGNTIAEKKTTEYKNRLTSYIDQYRIHLTEIINNDIARCQPLWNLFHATRLMLCKHVMDPLNGFWFSIVWCLVLMLCATPISLKLVDCYRLRAHSQISNMSGSPSKNLMLNEQGKDWATPNGNADSGGGEGW